MPYLQDLTFASNPSASTLRFEQNVVRCVWEPESSSVAPSDCRSKTLIILWTQPLHLSPSTSASHTVQVVK
jgi:hypothetical protein